MNIYEDEGSTAIVDLRAAAHELRQSGSIINDAVRRATVAEIQTAALLDIALSLRVVAAEAEAALPEYVTEATEPEPPADRDFLVVGDLVAVDGAEDPAEVTGFGFSEGSPWVDVVFPNGVGARPWLSAVHRLVGDERDDASMKAAAESTISELRALNTAADAEGVIEPEDLVDDVDADFEGDTHVAAATALDTLKANEAARKAAKKKASKK